MCHGEGPRGPLERGLEALTRGGGGGGGSLIETFCVFNSGTLPPIDGTAVDRLILVSVHSSPDD